MLIFTEQRDGLALPFLVIALCGGQFPQRIHPSILKHTTKQKTECTFGAISKESKLIITVYQITKLIAMAGVGASMAVNDFTSVLHHGWTLFTTIFCVLASFLLQLRFKTGKKTSKRLLPPVPSQWPIIGNLPEILLHRPAFRWILSRMKEMNASIACIRLGNVHVIPVTCPEIAREFLKKHDSIFASRPITMATEYSSRGFLTVAVVPWGDQWKKMRRVVASEVMTPARLRWLLEKRTGEADNLVRFLHNQCKSCIAGQMIDVRAAVRHYSANAIRKMIFNQRYFGEGREDGGPGEEEVEHVDALFAVLSLLYAFCPSDYVPWLRWLDLNGHEKVMKKAIGVVNKYHDPVIERRMEEWRSGIKRQAEDVLDVLISLKDVGGRPVLTTEEIKAQCAVRAVLKMSEHAF